METPQIIPIEKMSLPELQDRLNYLARRAQTLSGFVLEGGRQVAAGPAVANFFKTLVTQMGDPAHIEKRNRFMAEAERDPVKRMQLCALRLETYNNYLMAQLQWINFYGQIVNLGPEDRPMEQNTTQQEVTCYYISADGRVEHERIRKDDVETFLPLRFVTTPAVRMKEVDIYRGNIVDAALQVLSLSSDLMNTIENEFFTMVKANAFGTFTFTGKKATYPYVANRFIKIGNLPTTNDVTVTGANGSSNFNFATLDDIIDYAARWADTDPGGNLQPTGRIRLPSSHVRAFSDGITPSGATANAIADSLLEKGWTGIVYRGVNWVFIPDNTLDPAEFICYPEFNRKPARVFFKPSLDREVVRGGDQDYELSTKNEQERWMRKAYGASINTATRRNIARFKYRT